MKLNSLNKVIIVVLSIITVYLLVKAKPRAFELKTQEQLKQESRNQAKIVPVISWYSLRQGGSNSYSSDGSYSSRGSYGGGSSYGK